MQACNRWKKQKQDRFEHLVRRAGRITSREQDVVTLYRAEISALSERGLDSVLLFHLLQQIDPNDLCYRDMDVLEESARKSISKVGKQTNLRSICTIHY